MKKPIQNLLSSALFAVVAFSYSTVFGQAAAQEAPAKLKTADQVLARYTEATGGIDKYKAIKSLAQEGKLSLPTAGIQGIIKSKYAGPGKLLITVEIPAVGHKESKGLLGEIGWEESVATGSRLITGNELEELKTESDMRQYYAPKEIYKELELLDKTENVDGEEAYVVKTVKASGSIQYEFYSVDSGLKLKTKGTAETAMGTLETEIIYSDYKEFDGIQHATKFVQKVAGQQVEFELEKVETNVEFDEGTFDYPDAIKKLVEKAKASGKSNDTK